MISTNRRAGRSRLIRILSFVLTLFVAGSTFSLDAASASVPGAIRTSAIQPPDQFGVRAKSEYEQVFNPFGDEWATKGAANPSVPVGLTPACFKQPPKNGAGPVSEEVAFLAKTNSPFLWEECADVYDASGPDITGKVGAPTLKANIEAIKAVNPSVKYIGYLALVRAETFADDGTTNTVGLHYINNNREDWFVHIKNTDPTSANRILWSDGRSNVYDITNADFRQFMVARIVESFNYHSMDGVVLDKCFDLPEYTAATPPPDAVIQNWEAGCLSILSELRAALDPLGKFVFFTGYVHLGTGGTGPVNDAASEAFYQRRIDRAHGFYWEDPLRAVTAPDAASEFSFERAKRLRDYAVARNRYLVNIVNTNNEGQSSFGSTNATEQRRFIRFGLAGHLALMAGPLTPIHLYTPTSQGSQFLSATHYKDWDLPIGPPVGAETKPTAAVYVREFQRARVVFNTSSNSYTVNLSDGQFTNADGQAVGASAVVGAKSGAILLRVLETVTCTPRPRVVVTTTRIGGGSIRVDVTAGSTAGSLRTVKFEDFRTAALDIVGGPSDVRSAYTHAVGFGTKTVSFILRKVGGNTSTVSLTVTDGCGDWRTFVGAGSQVT